MGDMGEIFNAMRKAGQEKRAKNRESSPAILDRHGIQYESKNYGAHLIVEGKVDFWPGTGKWIVRDDGRKGRGVMNLVRYLNTLDKEE